MGASASLIAKGTPEQQAVWRGVKNKDLTGQFPKGKKIWWWAFNSTSKNVSTLLNPMFCGTSGTRTQFMIEAVSGIDIAAFSTPSVAPLVSYSVLADDGAAGAPPPQSAEPQPAAV